MNRARPFVVGLLLSVIGWGFGPARLAGIPRPPRQATQIRRCVVLPKRDRRRHGKPLPACHLESPFGPLENPERHRLRSLV